MYMLLRNIKADPARMPDAVALAIAARDRVNSEFRRPLRGVGQHRGRPVGAESRRLVRGRLASTKR